MNWTVHMSGDTTVTPDEMFPDGDGSTLDDLAALLAKSTLDEFLHDWEFDRDLTVSFVAEDGRVLDWDGRHATIRDPRGVGA